MHIVYIHGNSATPSSFNFIRTHMAGIPETLLSYDSRDGFRHNYRRMLAQVRGLRDVFLIAHSLGGIYAVHLANELKDDVLGAVTISTPYGGSEEARLAKYMMPFNQVLNDIQPYSRPIVEARTLRILHPWTNIVSTAGSSPLMAVANDGVVTQKSMRYRRDIRLVEVASNHYEILLNPETVAIIKKAMQEVASSPRGQGARRGLPVQASFGSALRRMRFQIMNRRQE